MREFENIKGAFARWTHEARKEMVQMNELERDIRIADVTLKLFNQNGLFDYFNGTPEYDEVLLSVSEDIENEYNDPKIDMADYDECEAASRVERIAQTNYNIMGLELVVFEF